MSERFANVVAHRRYQGTPFNAGDPPKSVEVRIRQDGSACITITGIPSVQQWSQELTQEQRLNLAEFLQAHRALLWEDVEGEP